MTLYITKNDQKLGPYSLDEVQKLVASGTLLPTDWAWYEGLTTWIPIHQIPGYVPAAATPGAPVPPAERPVLVWVICLFFFICTPFSLLSLLLLPLMASGAIPVADAQRHYFQSQNYFDYGLSAFNLILTLTWAILFFMLKRQSLFFLLGALGLGIVALIYNIVAKDWLATVGTMGLFIAGISWALNLAILYYNWHLYRKGVLR